MKPWPRAKASIGSVAGPKIIGNDEPKTTPEQIEKICAIIDKKGTQNQTTGDYKLPTLPQSDMRIQRPILKPMVRQIIKRQ
jgi:hypothetical protein